MTDTLREAIHKKSRPLADLESEKTIINGSAIKINLVILVSPKNLILLILTYKIIKCSVF